MAETTKSALHSIVNQLEESSKSNEIAEVLLDQIFNVLNDTTIPHLTSCIDSCQQHLTISSQQNRHNHLLLNSDEQSCWMTTCTDLELLNTKLFRYASIVRHCTFEVFQPLFFLYQMSMAVGVRAVKKNTSANVDAESTCTIQHFADRAKVLTLSSLNLIREYATPRELISVTMQHVASIYDSHILNSSGLNSLEKWYCQRESLVQLLQMLKHGLKQVPSGKRYMFYAHSLPMVIQRTFAYIMNPPDSHLSHDPDHMQQLAMEKQASDEKFAHFVPVLTEYALELSLMLKPFDFQAIRHDSNMYTEHCWILFFCFQLLVKLYSSSELIHSFENSAVVTVMESIANCNCTFEYILKYVDRHATWQKIKTQMEIEELEDRAAHMDEEEEDVDSDDDVDEANSSLRNEINRFVTWDLGGVAIFAYCLFVRGITRNQYSFGLFTMTHLFHRARSYIEVMLQNSIPSLSMLAKTFCRFFMDILPNYSLQLRQPEKSPARIDEIAKYFSFVQALINFMARCPDNRERTDSYNILNDFISKFPDDGRYELLSHTLRSCPYPILLGLMINRLKDEVRLEYDSLLTSISHKVGSTPVSTYKPAQPLPVEEANRLLRSSSSIGNEMSDEAAPPVAPTVHMDQETIRILRLMGKSSIAFLQKNKVIQLIVEILPKYISDVRDVDNLDVIISAFNLLYFLALRDHAANLTGICDGENAQLLSDKLISPLRQQCAQFYEETNKMQTEDEDDSYLDELNLDELAQDPDCELTPDEIETLRELQHERQNRQELTSVGLLAPSPDLVQVRLKLFALDDVLQRVETILGISK